jgi:chaperonin GroEL (HSP60 family)
MKQKDSQTTQNQPRNIEALKSHQSIIFATESIIKVLKTSYGFDGKYKIIQSLKEGEGSITLTSYSQRIFSSLLLQHPIPRLIITLAEASNHWGDCGLFLVLFSSK